MNRLRNLNWTTAEKSAARNYETGQIVQFIRNARGFKAGERLTILGKDAEGRVLCRNEEGEAKVLALGLEHAEKFQVYRPEAMDVAVGEQIRITQGGSTVCGNHRLENGSVYKVKKITEDHLVLNNGWRLDLGYGHLTHAYVMTSHAVQGRDVDEVIISEGSESFVAADAEQFYVSASRGKSAVRVYTDDKAGLKSVIAEYGGRKAAIELVDESQSQNPESRYNPIPLLLETKRKEKSDRERAEKRVFEMRRGENMRDAI